MPPKNAYPTPLTFPPSSGRHTHTFILLHGRGSNGERFGREFMDSSDIASLLPTVRFVFPTASRRRSTVLKRMPIRQWFDNYSLDDPGQRPDLQVDGLCETAEFLRSLVESEAELLLGHESHDDGDDDDGDGDVFRRIIVGGLSQGCAASVFALLGGEFGFGGNLKDANGPGPLGAFVGMSGWLPFHAQLRDIARSTSSLGSENGDDFDPFSTSADDGQDEASEHGPESPLVTAINHVRDILDLPPLRSPDILSEEKPAVDHLRIPVLLGHGSADPKVSVQLGEKMADFLSAGLSMDVTWKAYEGFGHWYKVPDEIDDIVCFLKEKVGVPGCE